MYETERTIQTHFREELQVILPDLCRFIPLKRKHHLKNLGVDGRLILR